MPKLIILVSFLLLSKNVFADGDIEKLVKPLLASISSGEVKNLASLAFPKIHTNRRYISDSDLEALDLKFYTSVSTLGDYYGYKLLHQATIQDLYVIQYYVLKYRRQPLLLKMEFYKPNDQWFVNGMELDDDLDVYMEDSAKENIGSNANN